MSLRIAVDVDGCLYDFPSAFWEAALQDQHGIFTAQQRDEIKAIPLRERPTMWDFWKQVDVSGAQASELIERNPSVFDRPDHTIFAGITACRKLMEQGHRVELLTKPWASIEFEFRTRRTAWMLDAFHGFPPHGIRFTRGDESKNDFDFDVIIEDRVETAVEVAQGGRHAILIAAPYNDPHGREGHRWGALAAAPVIPIDRVSHWSTVPTLIHSIEESMT